MSLYDPQSTNEDKKEATESWDHIQQKASQSIYNNEFKNELEHCFSTKCQENEATAELIFSYDEELISYFTSDQAKNMSMFIFTKRTGMVG